MEAKISLETGMAALEQSLEQGKTSLEGTWTGQIWAQPIASQTVACPGQTEHAAAPEKSGSLPSQRRTSKGRLAWLLCPICSVRALRDRESDV